jgi:hypothetical protein
MLYSHLSYSVISGTAGLQEAIDYGTVGSQIAVVILTPPWAIKGGTTSTITSAYGNTNVSILDERTSSFQPYAWNGSAYVATGGILPLGCSGFTVGILGNLTCTGTITGGVVVAGTPIALTSGGTGAATATGALTNLSGIANCGDPSWAGADPGAKINACMASLEPQGGEALIPAGTYTINTQIQVPPNIWLLGQGYDATILAAGSTLEAPCLALPTPAATCQVIRVLGTSGTPTANVHISDLTVENGTPQTNVAPVPGMDGIRADYVNGLLIERVHATSIQGAFGIAFKNSNGVRVLNSVVKNYAYAGVFALEGNNHVWVERNDIGGATCVPPFCAIAGGGDSYGFASGSEAASGGAPFTTNLWVDHNFLHDIPYWECLDTHGGQHVWFEDNTLNNCATGINASGIVGPLQTVVSSGDFHVNRNSVTQGTGAAHCTNCFGLITDGDSAAYPVKDVEMIGNNFTGFGNPNSSIVGVITYMNTRNVKVDGNSFYSWNTAAIMPYVDNWGSEIKGNTAYDMAGTANSGLSSMILIRSPGNWGLTIDDNTLDIKTLVGAPALPAYMINNASQATQVTLGANNKATYVTTALYRDLPTYLATSPVNTALVPQYATVLNAKVGDPIYDTLNRPNWHFGGPLMPQTGYSSLDTTDVISTGTCNLDGTVTSLSGGLGSGTWWYWFPEGMNIVLPGCGTGGTTLNAEVIADDGLKLTVSPAPSVSAATSITYQAATVNNAQDMLDSTIKFSVPNGCTNGCQTASGPAVTPGAGAVINSSYGFMYSSDAPYSAFNAIQTPGSDLWTQQRQSTSSSLMVLSSTTTPGTGLPMCYEAAAGTGAGNAATFWGNGTSMTPVSCLRFFPLTQPTAGQILVGNGTAWVPSTMSGSCTMASGGAITCASGGMTWPTFTGLTKYGGSSNWVTPTYVDVTALFGSGSCSGYLKSDGTCSTPGGGGTVTTSGSPVSPNIAAFSGSTAITAATSANIQTTLGAATSSVNGYLTSTDWATFNGKQPALSLLKGTYTDGDMCTYSLLGTLLSCNTAVPTGMTYPGAGIGVSTGSAWGTSLTAPTGALVGAGQANTYTAGAKQTFASSATTAGMNFGGIAGNPSSPVIGDLWRNTTAARLSYYDDTSTVQEIAELSDFASPPAIGATTPAAATFSASGSSITAPTLSVTATNAGTPFPIVALAPNMSQYSHAELGVGQGTSNYNLGFLDFYYAGSLGSSSTASTVALGLRDAGNLFTCWGTTHCAVGTSTDNGYQFQVNGTTNVTGVLTVGGTNSFTVTNQGVASDLMLGWNGTVSGVSNVLIGPTTDSNTLTSGYNTCIGNGACSSLITVSGSNVAIGNEALASDNYGGSNVAVGSNAGSTATGGNNIFIGFNTAPSAAADTNEIVIANSSTSGKGPNTTTIGNSTVTATYLAGVTLPLVIYSHAGTQLAACASGLQGGVAVVSDATALVPGTAYSVTAGAGADTVRVQCTLVSGTYAWQTM